MLRILVLAVRLAIGCLLVLTCSSHKILQCIVLVMYFSSHKLSSLCIYTKQMDIMDAFVLDFLKK